MWVHLPVESAIWSRVALGCLAESATAGPVRAGSKDRHSGLMRTEPIDRVVENPGADSRLVRAGIPAEGGSKRSGGRGLATSLKGLRALGDSLGAGVWPPR